MVGPWRRLDDKRKDEIWVNGDEEKTKPESKWSQRRSFGLFIYGMAIHLYIWIFFGQVLQPQSQSPSSEVWNSNGTNPPTPFTFLMEQIHFFLPSLGDFLHLNLYARGSLTGIFTRRYCIAVWLLYHLRQSYTLQFHFRQVTPNIQPSKYIIYQIKYIDITRKGQMLSSVAWCLLTVVSSPIRLVWLILQGDQSILHQKKCLLLPHIWGYRLI